MLHFLKLFISAILVLCIIYNIQTAHYVLSGQEAIDYEEDYPDYQPERISMRLLEQGDVKISGHRKLVHITDGYPYLRNVKNFEGIHIFPMGSAPTNYVKDREIAFAYTFTSNDVDVSSSDAVQTLYDKPIIGWLYEHKDANAMFAQITLSNVNTLNWSKPFYSMQPGWSDKPSRPMASIHIMIAILISIILLLLWFPQKLKLLRDKLKSSS